MANMMNAAEVRDFLAAQIDAGLSPARVHSEMCNRILEVHVLEYGNHWNDYRPNITLLGIAEEDAELRVLPYAEVENVCKMMENVCKMKRKIFCLRPGDEELAQYIQNHFVNTLLSDLRKSAHTLITSLTNKKGVHPFKRILVSTTDTRITIDLREKERSPLFRIEYYQGEHHRYTIRFSVGGREVIVKNVRGVHYRDLAASELVQILEYSMAEGNNTPRVRLHRLEFNTENGLNAAFNVKVRQWMADQRDRLNKVVSTETFYMHSHRYQPPDHQPFDLIHIRPTFLKYINARIIGQHNGPGREHGIDFLRRWIQMPQYTQCSRRPDFPEEAKTPAPPLPQWEPAVEENYIVYEDVPDAEE